MRKICTENNLYSVAIDILKDNNSYLVNEIQIIYGNFQDHILEVNGKAGRYIYNNDQWIFETGIV